MLSFCEYDSSAAPFVRLRNAARQYWDFTNLEWDASESADTKINYSESANGDGTSLYVVDLTLPSGGPYIQEAVLPSGEVIACDTTALDAAMSQAASPPSVIQIRQEMDSNSTKLAYLDASVSSRSTYSGGPVLSVTGNVGGSVASVTTPVTVGTNNDKSGYSLSAAGVLAIWNQATAAVGILVNTFGAKLRDLVVGADNAVKISSDAQDLSATLKVDAKVVEDKAGYALTAAYDAAKTAASQTSVNSIPTNPLLVDDVRLNNLNAPIGSIPTTPLLAANYTAPDNATVVLILNAIQNAAYGLARLDAEIDAITTAVAGLSTNTDMQTLLTRLSNARAALIDNLQYLTAVPGITAGQAAMLEEARDEAKLSRQLAGNKAVVSADGLIVTIYGDDAVTPLHIFDISADLKTRTPQ